MDKVASFTPAPWAITKGAYGALHVGPARLDHPGKARIEYALDNGGHDLLAQRDADARLIEAAPKMLAALWAIANRLEEMGLASDTRPAYDKAIAALRDATGRSANDIAAEIEGGAA
jgi:hypothetical protein